MIQETLGERLPAALKRLERFLGSAQADRIKDREFVADLMAILVAAKSTVVSSVPKDAVPTKQLHDDSVKTVGALVAWGLAIRSCIGKPYPITTSLEELAAQFARQMTDKIHLNSVSNWFDWDVIEHYLTNQNMGR